MLTHKQDIIDAYGHFFVLCERRYPHAFLDYSVITRVSDNVEDYGTIGNLDYAWRPNPPDQFEIFEYFGTPSEHEYGMGILDRIKVLDDEGFCIFGSLKEAEARAEILRASHDRMYEELRDIEKTRKLDFATATPDIPTVQVLQPDTLEFPVLIKEGKKLYAFPTDVGNYPLDVLEADIVYTKLSVASRALVGETSSHDYDLTMKLQVSQRDGSQYLLEHAFFLKRQRADSWAFFTDGQNDPLNFGGLSFATSKEQASKGLTQYANKIYANIRHVLPEAKPETPQNEPTPEPAAKPYLERLNPVGP